MKAIVLFMMIASPVYAGEYKSAAEMRDDNTNKQVSEWNIQQERRSDDYARESRELSRERDDSMRDNVKRSVDDLYIHSR